MGIPIEESQFAATMRIRVYSLWTLVFMDGCGQLKRGDETYEDDSNRHSAAAISHSLPGL